MSSNITRTIKKAISIVEGISDPYNKIAFEIVLEHLLLRMGKAESVSSKSKQKPPAVQRGKDNIELIIKSDYDWSNTKIQKLPSLGQCLYILKIGKNEFNINQLSASDIQIILNQKFRLSKTINTIGMSLMKGVGNYVDRFRMGNEYFYRITPQGEERLEKFIKKVTGVQ